MFEHWLATPLAEDGDPLAESEHVLARREPLGLAFPDLVFRFTRDGRVTAVRFTRVRDGWALVVPWEELESQGWTASLDPA